MISRLRPGEAATRFPGVKPAGAGGFTLIEVMLAMMVLMMTLVSLLYVSMSSVRLNRESEIYIAASNVATHQFNQMIGRAGSRENTLRYDGSSKALIRYVKNLGESMKDAFGFDVEVSLDSSTGILYYGFKVPEPGLNYASAYQRDATQRAGGYELGRGVVMIYLKEAKVPAEFNAWSTIKKGNSVPDVPNDKGFDMDADGVITDDNRFIDLYTGASNGDGVVLKSLPMTITVRYYNNAKDCADDRASGNPGFGSGPDKSRASFTRNYVINNDVLSGLIGGK